MRIALIAVTIAALGNSAEAQTPEDLYAEGQAAFDRADYTTAITKWQTAYQLSGASLFLFNVAQAQRLSGDCVDALSTYKRFIELDPTDEHRPLAEDLSRELEPTCRVLSAPRPVPVPTPVAAVPDQVSGLNLVHGLTDHYERSSWSRENAGLVIGAAGAASIGVGLVLGHHASTLGGDVTHACAISCDWAVQKSTDAAGHRDAAIGYVLDGLGIAAIIGGSIAYYLGDRTGGVTLSPRSHEGAVLSWSKTW